jgi:transposase
MQRFVEPLLDISSCLALPSCDISTLTVDVVERTPGVRGFTVLPKRWIVERTFGWLSRNRRMSKDYERKVQTSETFIEVAMIRLLVARLVRGA